MLIEKLARAGVTVEQIADITGVSKRTLERSFDAAIKKGRNSCAALLRAELVDRALNGNTIALLFACKTLAGLRENGPTPEELEREREAPRQRGLLIITKCECGKTIDNRPPGFRAGERDDDDSDDAN